MIFKIKGFFIFVPILGASVCAGARASVVLIVVQVVASRDRVDGRRSEKEEQVDECCLAISDQVFQVKF